MPMRAGLLGGVLPLLGALVACSAGQVGAGSTNHDSDTTAGAPSIVNTGVAGNGSPSINTSSGELGDGGDDGCGSTLDVTFRDFSEAHPDFEMPFSGDVVRRGLIEVALGADQKPVFKDSVGHPPASNSPVAINTDWTPTQPVIHGAATFAQWYNTTPGVNVELPKRLVLVETTQGSGVYAYDNSAFFPLAPDEGFGVTPKGNDLGMNFLFTTEIHVFFTYTPAQKFTFRGDDDLWIFVNGKLALDLGSMHGPEEGTIDFDAQASSLGITSGGSYAMDIFHAERHTRGSNFKITTNIACFTPSVVK